MRIDALFVLPQIATLIALYLFQGILSPLKGYKMRYLYDVKLWDRIETGVEFLIFAALMIAAIIKLGHNDFLQALFYIVLAVIISPWSQFERVTKRYVLVSTYILGLFVGYFS